MRIRVDEQGMALVVATMTVVLMLAIGAGLVMAVSSEVMIASNFRRSQQALYAADAAAQWAAVDVPATVDDWPTLLTTSARSGFVDGVASGTRTLPDGSSVDLTALVQRNASWKPYAYGLLRNLLPPAAGAIDPSPFYVMVFVAADAESPDRVRVRAHALGPRGAYKVVEMSMLRDGDQVRPVSWVEVR